MNFFTEMLANGEVFSNRTLDSSLSSRGTIVKLPLSINSVNGNFHISFPLTPSLSLRERVNHFAPLVGTSRAMDLQPRRQMLLPLPKGPHNAKRSFRMGKLIGGGLGKPLGWGEGEGSARNPLLPGPTHALQNRHEPGTFTRSKREICFRRILSMRCVDGNFHISFPLTPSLSLRERVNHFAPLVGTSRAMDLQPRRQMLLPLPKGPHNAKRSSGMGKLIGGGLGKPLGWGEGEGSARNPLLPGPTHALQNRHEPGTFTRSKREICFRRILSMRCVDGNFHISFPLTPSLSLR